MHYHLDISWSKFICSVLFVDNLCYPDDCTFVITHRHTQDTPCPVARQPIHRSVEPRILKKDIQLNLILPVWMSYKCYVSINNKIRFHHAEQWWQSFTLSSKGVSIFSLNRTEISSSESSLTIRYIIICSHFFIVICCH